MNLLTLVGWIAGGVAAFVAATAVVVIAPFIIARRSNRNDR